MPVLFGGATLSSSRALRASAQNLVRIRRQSRLGACSQAAGRANIRPRRNSGIRLQCILIKKMPIGIFEQGRRSEPFPCVFRGDICEFSSQISPLFSLFAKKSLLKKYVLKGKLTMASSRSPPSIKILLQIMIISIIAANTVVRIC